MAIMSVPTWELGSRLRHVHQEDILSDAPPYLLSAVHVIYSEMGTWKYKH